MTEKGFKLTRFTDDWLIVCKSRIEAQKALQTAREELGKLGLTLHPGKTRITNIKWGFEFLGYKIKQGKGLKLPNNKIKATINAQNLYAFPTDKSIVRFMDTIRQRTKRKIPITLKELVDSINPVIRGWERIIVKPMYESCSTDWIDGLSDAFGVINSRSGEIQDGESTRPRDFTRSMGW